MRPAPPSLFTALARDAHECMPGPYAKFNRDTPPASRGLPAVGRSIGTADVQDFTGRTTVIIGSTRVKRESAHSAPARRDAAGPPRRGQRAPPAFPEEINRNCVGLVLLRLGVSLAVSVGLACRECDGDGRLDRAAFSSSRGTLAGRPPRAMPTHASHVGGGWVSEGKARSRPVPVPPPVAWLLLTVSLDAPARALTLQRGVHACLSCLGFHVSPLDWFSREAALPGLLGHWLNYFGPHLRLLFHRRLGVQYRGQVNFELLLGV